VAIIAVLRTGYCPWYIFLILHHLKPNHGSVGAFLQAGSTIVTIAIIEHIMVGRAGNFHSNAVFYTFGTGEIQRIRNYIHWAYLNACFALGA
jgi:hypothetical protein